MNEHDIVFTVGSIVVRVEDFAKAIAVQRGEEMNDPAACELRIHEAKDVLDRAFRYARDRRDARVRNMIEYT